MRVGNGERSMKTTIVWKSALVVLVLPVALFHVPGEAAPMAGAGPQAATQPSKATAPASKVTFRPLSDFLDAQGTTDMFFPPVRDYEGWTDNQDTDKFTKFALVDYAGFANRYLHDKLGTRVHGLVIQSELASGRAQIEVVLFTTNALGFAQSGAALRSSDFDFLHTPTIFGNKAQDVARGEEAAVGHSIFWVTFSISRPGGPLPDLVADKVLDSDNNDDFLPVNVNFTATIPGKCKHGTKAVLHVDQSGPPGAFGTEIVEIVSARCD
jgi:hypothetical protein